MAHITSFGFEEGDSISDRYEVISRLGSGWEAEVYLVKEKRLGIELALKIFFPHRNKKNVVAKYHAKKLHKLRDCSILIQYHAMETYIHTGINATYLVSEYIDGELLSAFLKRQPKKIMHPFQALHLCYAIVCGLEEIHLRGEYHGDLHTDNIIIRRQGLSFDVKLVDLFYWKHSSKATNMQDDLVAVIHILYEVLGGSKHYATQPQAIKDIILGKRKDLILKKFKHITKLKEHIEGLEWN